MQHLVLGIVVYVFYQHLFHLKKMILLLRRAVILITFFFLCMSTATDIPVFEIDLDGPPMSRWDKVAAKFDGKVFVKAIDEALDALNIGDKLKPIALKIAADLDSFVPQPYADEMRGLGNKLDIGLGYVVLGNIFYDAYTYSDRGNKACTSIVANGKDGYVIHGRNLDYIMSDILVDLVVHIKYQKGGKTLFESINIAGQIGFVTSSKPGVFSMTLNERDSGYWYDNALAALQGYLPAMFYFREVVEKATSYEGALEMLQHMKIISPAYFIVGGLKPYEGAVVIGDRNGAIIERMNNTLQHGWFVVETNYDPWTTPPPEDDRRDAAIKLMMKLGEKSVDPHTLFQVLSTPPVLQGNTIYTTIMSAKNESIFSTVLRK